MTNCYEEARGHWFEVLSSNGIDSSFLKNKHGPCPICGGKDRFRFDDKGGTGSFFCNHCGAGDGIRFLRIFHNCDFRTAIEMVERTLGVNIDARYSIPKKSSPYLSNISLKNSDYITSDQIEKRRYKLNKTWSTASSITTGDAVQCYLWARGICLNLFPATLRYHPALPYYEDKKLIGKFTAMVGLVTDYQNEVVNIHRTFLENSCKANVSNAKKLMPPIRPNATIGGSIKLYEPENGILAVSEGIENALAFYFSTQIPVWSAISAAGMEKIILPATVKDVIILVDNDSSGRGQKAALILSDRLLKEGRTVKRVMPPKVNSDFADLLLEGY